MIKGFWNEDGEPNDEVLKNGIEGELLDVYEMTAIDPIDRKKRYCVKVATQSTVYVMLGLPEDAFEISKDMKGMTHCKIKEEKRRELTLPPKNLHKRRCSSGRN